MEFKKLRVGDWIVNEHGSPVKVLAVGYDYCKACFPRYGEVVKTYRSSQELAGLPLSSSLLEANGWENIAGRLILKTSKDTAFHGLKNRIGYEPSTGELVVNYGSVPVKVLYFHELQHILCDCGLDEYADNFKIEHYG